MTYSIVAIREVGDGGDATMYPSVNAAGELDADPEDGRSPLRFLAVGLSVGEFRAGKLTEVASLSSVRIDVVITDVRMALVCRKYDKGGGWVGSSGATVVLNAASKIRAAVRSRGSVLVGHVRFPWLASAGYSPKSGWLDEEKVRLVVTDGTTDPKRTVLLDLVLPKQTHSAEVTRAIARRAAAYRLTHESLEPEEAAQLRAIAEADVLPAPEPKKFASYTMPTHWHAKPQTARPRPAQTEAGAQ